MADEIAVIPPSHDELKATLAVAGIASGLVFLKTRGEARHGVRNEIRRRRKHRHGVSVSGLGAFHFSELDRKQKLALLIGGAVVIGGAAYLLMPGSANAAPMPIAPTQPVAPVTTSGTATSNPVATILNTVASALKPTAPATDVSGTVKLANGIPAGAITTATPPAAVGQALATAAAAGIKAVPLYGNKPTTATIQAPGAMIDTSTGQVRPLTQAEKIKALGL